MPIKTRKREERRNRGSSGDRAESRNERQERGSAEWAAEEGGSEGSRDPRFQWPGLV